MVQNNNELEGEQIPQPNVEGTGFPDDESVAESQRSDLQPNSVLPR